MFRALAAALAVALVGAGGTVMWLAEVGIELDREATLDRLLSMRPGNIFAPFPALAGQYREITPVLTMDRAKTRTALRKELAPAPTPVWTDLTPSVWRGRGRAGNRAGSG